MVSVLREFWTATSDGGHPLLLPTISPHTFLSPDHSCAGLRPIYRRSVETLGIERLHLQRVYNTTPLYPQPKSDGPRFPPLSNSDVFSALLSDSFGDGTFGSENLFVTASGQGATSSQERSVPHSHFPLSLSLPHPRPARR